MRAFTRVFAAISIAAAASRGLACAASRADNAARGAKTVEALRRGASITVFEFFSSECVCQRAHDARLRALYADYAPRGVRFVVVDSEHDASPERDAAEARARGFEFSIVSDPDHAIADALDANSATFTVVLGADGRPIYRGGIDSDRATLHDDARAFVRDAIDAAIAGHPPPVAESKTLGCVLRRN